MDKLPKRSIVEQGPSVHRQCLLERLLARPPEGRRENHLSGVQSLEILGFALCDQSAGYLPEMRRCGRIAGVPGWHIGRLGL